MCIFIVLFFIAITHYYVRYRALLIHYSPFIIRFPLSIYIALTMPAVSTLAPTLRRVSTISTFPLRDAHTSAVVPYYKKKTNKQNKKMSTGILRMKRVTRLSIAVARLIDHYLIADIDLRPVSNEILDYIRITPASGP